jgi:hypothetical protein
MVLTLRVRCAEKKEEEVLEEKLSCLMGGASILQGQAATAAAAGQGRAAITYVQGFYSKAGSSSNGLAMYVRI